MPIHKNISHNVPFALVDNQSGYPVTGASILARRCLDGGVQENASGQIIELGNGQYVFNGANEDYNADYTVGLVFESAGCVPVHILFQMTYFRKNTAYNIPFLLLDVETSLGKVGVSPSGFRCLDGGTQEAVSGAIVERGNGQYVFQATEEDFNANDIVGFLITASETLPIHMIIDLIESYSPTLVLHDTPAAIIAHYLTGLALMSVPNSGLEWPLYISHSPDILGEFGTIYNISPRKDGRYMGDGEVLQHYGVTIQIKSENEDSGWDKCNSLAGQLDAVHNIEVILEGTTYIMRNISRVGGISSLGNETGTKRRRIFEMNFLTDISKN